MRACAAKKKLVLNRPFVLQNDNITLGGNNINSVGTLQTSIIQFFNNSDNNSNYLVH